MVQQQNIRSVKSILVIVGFLISSCLVCAQNADSLRVSISANNAPIEKVLIDIEKQVPVRFYYQPTWMDSVFVSVEINDTPITQALNKVFESTSMSFYIEGSDIILTDNVVIIDSPKILSSFDQQELEEIEDSGLDTELGLVFVREYQNVNTDAKDEENFVHDIGSRNKMVIGGKSTLVGYVRNSETKEAVIGALVYTKDPFIATTTDVNGFYSQSLPNGQHTVLYQYAGMKTSQRKIVLFSNGSLNVNMNVDIIALQEVVIESEKDDNIRDVKIGVNKIDVEETKTVPLALGERDIMKVATTMAGVQTVGEGASGYNVRGGKADQNLILLNGAPVYNSNHFFGFFSAFNADAIENMEVYKGSIPAKFGGRLSSVFDIQERSANKEKFSGSGGISPVTSRLTLEIPILKDQTSLLLGGRTTYSDWVLKQIDNANFSENEVAFYDIIGQVDHTIDENNSIIASGYFSKDRFRLASDTLFSFTNFAYTNLNGSVRWNRRFSNQLDGSLALLYSEYEYEILYDESPPNAFDQTFGINELTLTADMSYYPTEFQRINFGISSKRYNINPGKMMPHGSESNIASTEIQSEKGLESAIYLSDQYDINSKLTVYGGVRYAMFNALGPQDIYGYAQGLPKNNASRTDTTNYSSGQIIETYHGPEFRVFGRYVFEDLSSVKLSYNRTQQFVHTLSNTTSLSPTDTWRLSSPHLKPQIGDQISLGYYRNFDSNKIEASVEGYYKKMQNLVDFKVGASFLLNPTIETEILQGNGKSYGVEFSVRKSGRLNGWMNYTYSRTLMQLDGNSLEEIINQGAFYPTSYDKPHIFNLVANYKFTHRISASANVAYSTGRPVTFPVAVYNFQGSENIHYSDRNAFRIPDYFRIDIGINLEGNHKIKKLAHSFWTFSVYNLLGRDNPYSVFFDVENGEVNGYQLVIFAEPIPTITYNFKF